MENKQLEQKYDLSKTYTYKEHPNRTSGRCDNCAFKSSVKDFILSKRILLMWYEENHIALDRAFSFNNKSHTISDATVLIIYQDFCSNLVSPIFLLYLEEYHIVLLV